MQQTIKPKIRTFDFITHDLNNITRIYFENRKYFYIDDFGYGIINGGYEK